MSRLRRDAIILAVVVVLLAVAAYFAFPLSKTNLGLDLQGGLSVILEAQDSARNPRTADGMTQAVEIIQNRVNGLGVAEPEIQRQGDWKISVQLPGIDDPEEALRVIGQTAVLEFYHVEAQFGTPYATQAEALAAAGVSSTLELPSGKAVVRWSQEGGNASTQWFLIDTPPALTGAMLKGAHTGFDQFNKPKVNMEFNDEGARVFEEVTTKLAETKQITGEDQHLAIVLDNIVESAPRVLEPIAGGHAEITGRFTQKEAESLALVLKTGALPVELKPVSQNSIGATLGQAALNQALIAGAIGFLLIVLFMIAYYRLLGLVASVALIIYGVLFLGILNAIGVTMTLPSIAGMILTLGMAVDANVLIFARMRDEVAAGKSISSATTAGFRKAFRAVFDCNMTTILTAIVLFWAATGGIKGFALTLGIGVALSMFTAVLVTRSLLSVLSEWSVFRHPKALGLHIPKAKRVPVEEGGRS